MGQLILRCTYASTNQWASDPAQDSPGVWLCASYLTSLCSLPLSENQVIVRNKYVTCRTHQCLDVISGMLMGLVECCYYYCHYLEGKCRN